MTICTQTVATAAGTFEDIRSIQVQVRSNRRRGDIAELSANEHVDVGN